MKIPHTLLAILAAFLVAPAVPAQIRTVKVTGGEPEGVVKDGPTWAGTRLQARKGKGKAFVYYFDQRSPGSPDGSNHAAEIGHVFRDLGGRGASPPPESVALSELMSSYRVNFARAGDPNGPGIPPWPAFTEEEMAAMTFAASPAARPLPNLEKLKAFDAYYAGRRTEARSRQPEGPAGAGSP